MPQLRDSSTRAMHADTEIHNDFGRIFGIETEYGVSVTGADHAVDAGQVAMTMFQPVVSKARSTNTYLTNGSRLYLDVGSHPEYATAEALDPKDALLQDLAGERIMRRLAGGAQQRLRAGHGDRATIHVFKNNVDSAGHAFGCHENYLVRRFVKLELIEDQLLPFLITRQLYTGAGRFAESGFQITQRADFLDEAVSSATTRARPMINTRDEAHADPESYRRLHVIIGDSNRSQWATWVKLATTHLVLCVIEDAVRRGVPSGFEGLALADAAAANRTVSRFLDDRQACLTVGGGNESNGDESQLTALQIQRRYFDVVEAFVRNHGESIAAGMPQTSPEEVLDAWQWALNALEQGNIAVLADRVDWAMKYRLAQAMRRRDPRISHAGLQRLELEYHDVANGRLYDSLVAHGQLREIVERRRADQAVDRAPQGTRAALRGMFIDAAQRANAQYSCDWTTFTLTSPVRREAVLLDPFSTAPTPDFKALMAALPVDE